MKVGRNDLCPCGSGKKYKQCCDRKVAKRARLQDSLGKGIFFLFGPLAIALLLAVSVSALRGPGESDEVRRVWSAAHNHWHLRAPDGSEVEARPGIVWSAEEGRFVDADPISEATRKHVTSYLDQHLQEVAPDSAENEPEPVQEAEPEL